MLTPAGARPRLRFVHLARNAFRAMLSRLDGRDNETPATDPYAPVCHSDRLANGARRGSSRYPAAILHRSVSTRSSTSNRGFALSIAWLSNQRWAMLVPSGCQGHLKEGSHALRADPGCLSPFNFALVVIPERLLVVLLSGSSLPQLACFFEVGRSHTGSSPGAAN